MVSIASILFLAFLPMLLVDGAIKYSNCGGASDEIKLNNLVITPNPIKIPSNAFFDLNVDLAQDLSNPIKAVFKLTTKFLGISVTAPCTDGVGSCTYPDWCEFCKTCICPLLKGNVNMKMGLNVTSSVPTGTYAVQINFTSKTNQKGCVKIEGIEIKK